MPSILFVCTANQFRSPLAAACFMKSIGKENIAQEWMVESAGTWTKDGLAAPRVTLQVANQLGLDELGSHLTQQMDQDLLDRFDLIIVMETGHKEAISIEFPSVGDRLYLLSEIVDEVAYDIPDPAERGIDPNEIGLELHRLITRGNGKILQLAKSLSESRSLQGGDS